VICLEPVVRPLGREVAGLERGRAERFEDRTDANVAAASPSVPAPVANEEIVAQSVARSSITPQFATGGARAARQIT